MPVVLEGVVGKKGGGTLHHNCSVSLYCSGSTCIHFSVDSTADRHMLWTTTFLSKLPQHSHMCDTMTILWVLLTITALSMVHIVCAHIDYGLSCGYMLTYWLISLITFSVIMHRYAHPGPQLPYLNYQNINWSHKVLLTWLTIKEVVDILPWLYKLRRFRESTY